jgi:hypothetical protein
MSIAGDPSCSGLFTLKKLGDSPRFFQWGRDLEVAESPNRGYQSPEGFMLQSPHRAGDCPRVSCQQPREPTPAIPSIRAIDKRPKFTAKAQSSPSPRTRREAPGADPPIANRKNSGTVPAFFSGVRYYGPKAIVQQPVEQLLSPAKLQRKHACRAGSRGKGPSFLGMRQVGRVIDVQ